MRWGFLGIGVVACYVGHRAITEGWSLSWAPMACAAVALVMAGIVAVYEDCFEDDL